MSKMERLQSISCITAVGMAFASRSSTQHGLSKDAKFYHPMTVVRLSLGGQILPLALLFTLNAMEERKGASGGSSNHNS